MKKSFVLTKHMKRGKINKEHILFLFLLLLIFNLFYPYKKETALLKKGDIAPEDIIAPYAFKILKPEEQLKKEREEASKKVPPVLQLIEFTDRGSIEGQIDSLLKVSGSGSPIKGRILRNKKRIKNLYLNLYKNGIISKSSELPESENDKIMIESQDTNYIVARISIRNEEEARKYFNEEISKILGSSPYVEDISKKIGAFIKPNLLIDLAETEKRREEAKKSVANSIGIVRKGEKIVGAHEVVAEKEYRKLYSLKKIQSRNYPYPVLSGIARNQLYFLFIEFFILGFLFLRVKEVYKSRRFLYLFLINILFVLLFYRFLPKYLLPLSSFVMFFTLAVNIDFGVLIAIASALIISIYEDFSFINIIPVFTGSLVGGILLVDSRNREDWYRTGMIVAVTTALLIFSLEFYNRSSFKEISIGVSYGLINGFLSILILFALFFIFERAFNITTNFTWMEYSDLNNPLLKRMSKEAPGTYQHSLMVSTLAENAGEVVGANPLLSKVGGLYHDVGKLERPLFFAENIRDNKNPHNEIPPKLSALIIKSHIRDGTRIAKEYKLPEEIIDVINHHHGDALIVPFYEKAKGLMDEVQEEDFRYNSGFPVSKEAGIVMLADMVEATVRSMDNPTKKEIEEMIKKHINKVFSTGQLGKSKLSIKNLEDISRQFSLTLEGLYHHRPRYPSGSK